MIACSISFLFSSHICMIACELFDYIIQGMPVIDITPTGLVLGAVGIGGIYQFLVCLYMCMMRMHSSDNSYCVFLSY